MLHADKANLESNFRVRMLNIREKELMFFVRNCQNLANLAALIACMAQSGLIFTKYIDLNLCGQGLVSLHSKELLCAEFTYPIAVFITMGLCLLCMWVSMLVSLLAPGLALRGPDGSMHECVRMIGEEYEYALAIFACALLMFFVSAILWAWASQLLPVAVVLTLVLLASVRVIWSMTRYTVSSFSIAKADIVTGQMSDGRLSARSPVHLRQHGYAATAQHGYARLQEEHGAHPDATRHPRPPPLPKPARVWWGHRLVDHVWSDCSRLVDHVPPRLVPPRPALYPPSPPTLRTSPTALPNMRGSWMRLSCNQQACARCRLRLRLMRRPWRCWAVRQRAQAAYFCSGESGPSLIPALARALALALAQLWPWPSPGPGPNPALTKPCPALALCFERRTESRGVEGGGAHPTLNQARAALGAANQRRAASPPLAKARACCAPIRTAPGPAAR